MGGALSCFEAGAWDHAHHVHHHYRPAHEGGQDMSQPLSHYFISSGHNSYLTGNQLTSTAGTATIELGLKHGCRVVEVDVYDGPKEPVVTHGGTLTSSVTLHDCVRTIAQHGFSASPYPVILTIENHTKAQQAAMAGILRDVLGHHLFVPDPGQLEADGRWLSPEALKHKVVVRMKVKPGTDPALASLVYIRNSSIRSYDAAGAAPPSSHSLPDSKLPAVPEYAGIGDALIFGFKTPQVAKKAAELLSLPASSAGGKPLSPRSNKDGRLSDTSSSSERPPRGRSSGNGSSAAAAAGAGTAPAAAPPAAPAAAAPGHGVKQSGIKPLASFQLCAEELAAEEALQAELDDTLDVSTDSSSDRGGRGSSSSGGGAEPQQQQQQTALVRPHLASVLQYTSKHLLRCYPNALRMVDNSNPNPAASWARGVSLAALNWQLWDQAIWVNEAFFSRHNKCGYILKPDWMTTAICPEDCPPARQPRTLSVKVLSAFKPQLHRVSVMKDDPYVCLQMVGMPHDTAEQASSHKNNTGRLVVDRVFDFDVAYPELGVLLVLLKDHDDVMTDTVLGYTALPLSTLAPGAYKMPLAMPRIHGGFTTHTGMWVKLELQWQQPQDSARDPASPAPPAAA